MHVENNYSLSDISPQNLPSHRFGCMDCMISAYPYTWVLLAINKQARLDKELIMFEESAHHLFYSEPGIFAEEVYKFIQGYI
jgi:hypothetical protein